LKVAIFAQLLAGRAGGIETNLLELLHSLPRADASVRPLVIGPGASSTWLSAHVTNGEVLPWDVIRYQVADSAAACRRAPWPKRIGLMLRRARMKRSAAAASGGHHVASGRRLSDALRARGVEVLHFPYQRYFETDLPFIFEPWDLQHEHYPENFSAEELRFRDHLYREACQRAGLVVVPTRWGKRDLVAKFGVDERKVAVIGRGPGALSAGSAPQALPSRYIVYPAKFWPHKNHARLFDALHQLRAKGCSVPLVCTGEATSAVPEGLRRAVSLQGLQDQVTFLGHLERESLTAVLARAEVLVFPSLFEGFGIPVLEAMSLGVPVACSRLGPLDEIAGGAAQQFDAEDASAIAGSIQALWNDPGLRTKLGILGKRRAADFSWVESAGDFVACYKHLAGRQLTAQEKHRFAALTAS
jgi:glycosyltransferase involved in cell wall biosynthesis